MPLTSSLSLFAVNSQIFWHDFRSYPLCPIDPGCANPISGNLTSGSPINQGFAVSAGDGGTALNYHVTNLALLPNYILFLLVYGAMVYVTTRRLRSHTVWRRLVISVVVLWCSLEHLLWLQQILYHNDYVGADQTFQSVVLAFCTFFVLRYARNLGVQRGDSKYATVHNASPQG